MWVPLIGSIAMRFVFASVFSLLLASSAMAEPRGFTVNDLVNLDRVTDPQASPDGRWVSFQVRETDYEANKGVQSLWLVPSDGSAAPRRLTAKGQSSMSARWSHDGRSLYFLSARSGSMQVWNLPLAGGEATQVTSYPLDVGSYLLAPGDRRIAVSMEVFNDCAAADVLDCSKKRVDDVAARKRTGQVFDKLFIRHWDSWSDGRRAQLFVAGLADGKASAKPAWVSRGIDGDVPSKPFGDLSEAAFAPDGASIVFAARIAGRTEAWSTNFDLFTVPVDASVAPRNLTAANEAMDSYPVYSHDGRTLYYLAMKRPTFEADRLWIKAMKVADGSTREIAAGWDRSTGALTLSADGKTLYGTADDNGQHPLFAIDIASGKVRNVSGEGHINGFAIAGNTIVVARDTLTSPSDLYVLGKSGKRLTRFNAERLEDIRLGEPEFFTFAGWNDEQVQGYVVKPWNYEAGKKYPIAFLIHGGPQGAFGNDWHYRWNPQTYAGQGFAVIAINFHGSTGYGQAFTDSISGDWGGKPLEDLKKGMAAALAKYPWLNGDKACALGGSYGGYMVNWIAGNWAEQFDCIVSHASIFDNRFMGYSTEELWFDEWEMQGTPYDKPDNYELHNPVRFVKDWKVPVLVVHGALDFRVPVEQGIALFTALQRRGIESKFLYFPDENHWILKPHNSVQWHEEVNAWLKRWAGVLAPLPTPWHLGGGAPPPTPTTRIFRRRSTVENRTTKPFRLDAAVIPMLGFAFAHPKPTATSLSSGSGR
jgi:dipeptidyl aminopeptidase/acylaminoacyl peptidase